MNQANPRPTSCASWQEIASSGALAGLRLALLRPFVERGALTAREASTAAGIAGGWRRVSELAQLGLLAELEAGVCSVTHRRAIRWVWTGAAAPTRALTRAATPERCRVRREPSRRERLVLDAAVALVHGRGSIDQLRRAVEALDDGREVASVPVDAAAAGRLLRAARTRRRASSGAGGTLFTPATGGLDLGARALPEPPRAGDTLGLPPEPPAGS